MNLVVIMVSILFLCKKFWAWTRAVGKPSHFVYQSSKWTFCKRGRTNRNYVHCDHQNISEILFGVKGDLDRRLLLLVVLGHAIHQGTIGVEEPHGGGADGIVEAIPSVNSAGEREVHGAIVKPAFSINKVISATHGDISDGESIEGGAGGLRNRSWCFITTLPRGKWGKCSITLS